MKPITRIEQLLSGMELTPITRLETYIAYLNGQNVITPSPATREEQILNGQYITPITRREMFMLYGMGNLDSVPEPITREEWFWKNWSGGEPKEYEVYVSGILPLHLTNSVGADLVDWSITGNTVQNGTPNPENPIEVKGVGDRTGNLLDYKTDFLKNIDSYISNNGDGTYTAKSDGLPTTFKKKLRAGTYTMSISAVVGTLTNDMYVRCINPTNNAPSETFTLSTETEVEIKIRVKGDNQIFYCMLNEGSTPLPYEPYGVKIPVVSRGKNKYSLEEFTNAFRKLVLSKDENSIVSWICSQNSKSVVLFDNFAPNTQYVLHLFGKNDSASGSLWTNLRVNYSDGNSDSIKFTEMGVMSVASFVSRPNRTISSISNFWDTVGTTLDLSKSYIIEGSEDIYEPYRQPITTTQYLPTPLMANERLTPTARDVKWKELVLTGDETISHNKPNKRFVIPSIINRYPDTSGHAVECTHYYGGNIKDVENYGIFAYLDGLYLYDDRFDTSDNSVIAFKDFLKSEYDAGHPVTVWYQLANPTSESVETTPIGTLDGECWVDTDTEVRPPSMSATYKSSKPDNDMQLLMELFKEV